VTSKFKNRLVGVTILCASAIIFLPAVIDGEKNTYEEEFVSTPIRPEPITHSLVAQNNKSTLQDESNLTDSQQSEIVVNDVNMTTEAVAKNDDWQVEEVAQAVTVAKANIPVQQKTQKIQVPDNAWTIQLGAFQNASNINALLKQLREAGFQAHTVPVEVKDGVLTRVFVGPDVSEKRLKEQLPRLKKLTKLNGKVLPFKATKS
jgi:DedD protein